MKVAGPVSSGLEKLLGVTDGQLHVGLHQAFVAQSGGGNLLRSGYYAVIRAEESKIDRSRLWIREDRLRYGADMAGSQPYKEYAHMVFRIEGQATRDDWDALTTIADPRARMIEALIQGKTEEARSFLQAAKVAAFLAPDLTDAHKRIVATLLEKEHAEFGKPEGLEAVATTTDAARRSLAWAMKRAPSVDDVSAAPVTVDEILGSPAGIRN